jgi:hypothetical protein
VSEHRSSSSRWLDREEASIYAPIDLCDGALELLVLGVVTAPTAVLVRTDGYGAWGGSRVLVWLKDALTTGSER